MVTRLVFLTLTKKKELKKGKSYETPNFIQDLDCKNRV